MRKALLATAMAVMAAMPALAQKLNDDVDLKYYYSSHKGHYIHINGGITRNGHSIMDHSSQYWTARAAAGYQYFITPHWGLGMAAEYNKLKIDSLPVGNLNQNIDDAIDMDGNTYQQRILFRNFGEKTSLYRMSFPIGAYYQTNLAMRWKIMAGLGASLWVTNNATYSTYGTIETQAYYASKDLLLTEEDIKGYPNIRVITNSQTGKYGHMTDIAVFGELYLLYAINPLLDIYMRARAEYMASKGGTSKNHTPIYDTDSHAQDGYANMKYNGLLNTSEVDIHKTCPTISLGLRIRFGEMPPPELRHVHRKRDITDYETQRTQKMEDGRLKRKFGDIDDDNEPKVDSVLLAEEEMRRRKIHDMEIEMQKRQKDSLENIAAQDTKPVPPAPEDSKIITQQVDEQLAQLLQELNSNNYCAFNGDKVQGTGQQETNLDQLAQIMRDHSEITIRVTGHTCNIGTVAQNKIVGMRRAEAFKAVLVARGVPESQIHCESKWFSEPLVPNTSEANRAKNRRVELRRD